ncbi:sigma-70 family RNA polymerase sigma factor [Streptomyces sp. SID3343]|uniref:RNA polymerase sigma factor n=1 Tax=Streptomyces sp. SID3343 TaxID=2690260 RepID=UPI00136B25A9|nr:sigma-70 family RNA polymerase sigma factor [Streptomyces sp. SID3343]MYV97002.1 hypothetical protein [Streptomyces sp. SID3343]
MGSSEDGGVSGEDASLAALSGRDASETVRADFIAFTDNEYDAVVAHLRMRGAHVDHAADAAQEAFLELWDHMMRVGGWGSIVYPRSRIRAVAWNNYLRPPGQRRRQPHVVPVARMPPEAVTHPDHAGEVALARTLVWCLSRCDEQVRAVMAFQIQEFRAAETAAALGTSEQKVRDLLKKGRAQLKRALGEVPGSRQEQTR